MATPRIAFAAVLAVTALEFVRPQDWIAPLARAPFGIASALLLLVLLLLWGRRDLLRDPIVRVLGVLPVVALAWTPFATNRFWAFQSFKILLIDWITVLALASFVDRPARLRALLGLLLAAFAAHGLYAIGHAGKGYNAWFADENDLAAGMCAALPFAVFALVAARGAWLRLATAAGALVLVAGVVASASRGGLVALVATGGAMLVFAKRRLAIAAAVAAAALLLALLAPPAYWADMQTMFDPADETRASRIQFWGHALAIWLDHPILGVGPGNAPWVIGAYESFDTQVGASAAGRAVHSIYFTLLPEWGLVGVALYGALGALFVARCVRLLRAPRTPELHAQTWARALLCSAAACAAAGVFLSLLYYPHLYFLLGLALALEACSAAASPAPGATAPARRRGPTP
ncbi:MAG: hypothetical protein DCC71_17840, partial [Proteobacteria bacterium]